MNVSARLEDNIKAITTAFSDCGDLVTRKLELSDDIILYIAFIDNMINMDSMDRRLTGPILCGFQNAAAINDPYSAAKSFIHAVDIADEESMDKVFTSIMSGDTVLFAEGSNTAAIISSKGFQNRGVPSVSTEVTVMGSREAFSEVMRTNTVLIRRRIRDTRLKVKQTKVGRRSSTDIAVMYMDDLVRPEILEETWTRITSLDIDAASDSGILEQLIESKRLSPFPQAETTERPDKAAAAILEGRVAIIVDNSPFALIVPATLNTMFQSPEDYYQRFWIMSFTRIIRFAAIFMAIALPGLYLAAAIYHPAMLPSALMLKMAEARQNVPFPAVIEIFMMEAAFELLREAGTRMPHAIGGTLGIVGGLIVGQAAVQAGIVSPIVVIVVALTAISSFAVPSNSLVTGFRLVKFLFITLSAFLGLLGFWAAGLILLIHLAGLKSFGIPYLSPFVSGDVNGGADIKDSLIRMPYFMMKRRPIFTRPGNETRQNNKNLKSSGDKGL